MMQADRQGAERSTVKQDTENNLAGNVCADMINKINLRHSNTVYSRVTIDAHCHIFISIHCMHVNRNHN